MTATATANTARISRANSGYLTTALAVLFVATLPFSAMASMALTITGNFNANLALYPFLLLVPFLIFHPILHDVLWRKGPEGRIIRTLVVVFALVGALTLINGYQLQAEGYSAYGLTPLDKSVLASFVPLFIALLFLVSATVAQGIPAPTLQKTIDFAFWLVIGYCLLQAYSISRPNDLYSTLWPIIEGARERDGLAYTMIYERINGTTTEPAELVKLLLILFLPWALFPVSGRISWAKVFSIVVLVIAARSIVGLIMLAAVVPLLMLSGTVRSPVKIQLTILAIITVLVGLVFGADLLGTIPERLSNLRYDPSFQVRSAYNGIAIDIVKEHPILGIGWSNEIFFYPSRLREFTRLWEIRQNLLEGEALTAKTLILRLVMYTGIPLFATIVTVVVNSLASRNSSGDVRDQTRTRLAFIMFGLGSMIDGGIITSFFVWAGPALALGFQMRRVQPDAEDEPASEEFPPLNAEPQPAE